MKVTAFKTKNNHNHEEILNTKKQLGFNKETKAFIDDLIQKKVTISKIIFDALAEAHQTRPEIMMPKNECQLYIYLDGKRKKVKILLIVIKFIEFELN